LPVNWRQHDAAQRNSGQELLMLPHKHVLISAAVGVVGWWITGRPAALGAALIAGVLPDIDHLIDYSYYRWRGEHRLILPLHGYEFALLGGVLALRSGSRITAIAALSYLIHLLADQAENRTRIWGYAWLFRARHRFRIEQISTVPEAAMQGRVDDMEMLKQLPQRLQSYGRQAANARKLRE
jgi:hypothetical protein